MVDSPNTVRQTLPSAPDDDVGAFNRSMDFDDGIPHPTSSSTTTINDVDGDLNSSSTADADADGGVGSSMDEGGLFGRPPPQLSEDERTNRIQTLCRILGLSTAQLQPVIQRQPALLSLPSEKLGARVQAYMAILELDAYQVREPESTGSKILHVPAWRSRS